MDSNVINCMVLTRSAQVLNELTGSFKGQCGNKTAQWMGAGENNMWFKAVSPMKEKKRGISMSFG